MDIALSYGLVDGARWTASRWPKDRRVSGVSFTVHKTLASIADDEERFTTITSPPQGRSRWTPDEANRRVGGQVVKPVTPKEKVGAIHTLATDEEVAATVTSDPLRRPTAGRPGQAGGQSPGRRGTDPRRPRRSDGDHRPAAAPGRRLPGDVGRSSGLRPGVMKSAIAGPTRYRDDSAPMP